MAVAALVVVVPSASMAVPLLVLLLHGQLRGQRGSQDRVSVVDRSTSVAIGEDGHSVGVELLRLERQAFFAQVEVQIHDEVVISATRQERFTPRLNQIQRYVSGVFAVVPGPFTEVTHSICNCPSKSFIVEDCMKSRATVVHEHANELYRKTNGLGRL